MGKGCIGAARGMMANHVVLRLECFVSNGAVLVISVLGHFRGSTTTSMAASSVLPRVGTLEHPSLTRPLAKTCAERALEGKGSAHQAGDVQLDHAKYPRVCTPRFERQGKLLQLEMAMVSSR